MFNGLPATTTPNYQVWDFSQSTAAVVTTPRIALTDDCAPFQIIYGGSQNCTLNIYLPTNPQAGKQITIKASNYGGISGSGDTVYNIYDSSNSSATQLWFGKGNVYVSLIYVPQLTRYYANSGQMSCWIITNASYLGDQNVLSKFAVINGVQNRATAQYGTVSGGQNNWVSQGNSTIGGGTNNQVSGGTSVIAGGSQGNISAGFSFCSLYIMIRPPLSSASAP